MFLIAPPRTIPRPRLCGLSALGYFLTLAQNTLPLHSLVNISRVKMVIRKLYVPPVFVQHGAHPVHIEAVKPVIPNEAVAFSTVETDEEPTPTLNQDDGRDDDIIVHLNPGMIQGMKEVLPNGKDYFRFSGIPYAKPPTGELRFKPPMPLDKFDAEILDCRKQGSNCFSLTYYPPEAGEFASEDCLFLNVYTPKLTNAQANDALPVMVWIHGGGFNLGSGDAAVYGPEHLIQQGVVVVTLNYRLGPLGFLCLPSVGIYGNMGLKDQRLALQWVHENITMFGGDPTNVTLFGESAGGASVHLHYISESSRKYFHKAICMSGVSYNPWVLQIEPEAKARHLAKLVGAESNNDEDVYRALMNASAQDLVQQSPAILGEDEKRTNKFFAFTPVVELKSSEEPLLTENYISLMMRPNMTTIPLINGVTNKEGLLIAGEMLKDIEQYASNLTKMVPQELPLTGDRLNEAAVEIKQFFFGEDDITAERLATLVDIMSDNLFVMAAYVASELHARYQTLAPQYFYVDSFEGKLNKYRELFSVPEQLEGVCHSDELLYLFSSSMMGTEVEPDSREDKFRHIMCQMWTNFAKHGNPTPSEGGVDFQWDPVKSVSDSQFMLNAAELNDELKMVENPFHERIQFWRELTARYYGSYLMHESNGRGIENEKE